MPPPVDLRTILSDETLAAYRAAYNANPDAMRTAARGAVSAPFPPAAGYVDWVVGHLYDGEHLKHADRERCLIALLSSQCMTASLLLGVHLYWGLMEGLSVTEIANVLALSGTYTGLPHYTAGQASLRATLDEMVAHANKSPSALDPRSFIGALSKVLH